MKTKYLPYFLFVFMNIAVLVSCYYYPVSRDEFYYLEKTNVPNPFLEYYNSYFYVNPRINQFVCNVISRSTWMEIIFGLFLFNGFFSVLYLNVYRKLPSFSDEKEMRNFILFTSFFILLMNYFGEMFYYTPFSTNYTFSHILYLLYVFVLTRFYIEQKFLFFNKIPLLILIIGGIYTGMSNEHVPPVLLAASAFFALHYLIKNKKLPNYKMIVLNVSIFIGYLLLFFAPANRIKEATVKKSTFDISFTEYAENIVKILKSYVYYNVELLITLLIVLVTIVFNFKKIILTKNQLQTFFIYLFLSLSAIAIVGISPLIGMRLLFFSTILIIIILYQIIDYLVINNPTINKAIIAVSYLWIILFFTMSVFITINANKNHEKVMSEIETRSNKTKDVVLAEGFNYTTDKIGRFNRKILLEDGTSYIDHEPLKNTSQEKLIINFFKLKTLSHQ